MACKRFLIRGRVQGVGYRYSVLDFIDRQNLPLRGFVRNLPTGDVEVVVEGESESIEELYTYCAKGPSMSRVDEIIVSEGAMPDRVTGFSIKPS